MGAQATTHLPPWGHACGHGMAWHGRVQTCRSEAVAPWPATDHPPCQPPHSNTVYPQPRALIHKSNPKLNYPLNGGHYLVTTHSLRTYLATHPLTTPSAAELARQHQIDTKSATRILREFDYTQQLTSEGSGWKYSPDPQHAAKDPLTLLTMSLANGHLLYIPSSLTDSVLHKVPFAPYTTDPEDPERSKLTEAQEHWNAVLSTLPSPITTVDVQRYILLGLRLLLESGKLPIRAQITQSGIEPFTL